jgi:hypothetical protein
MPTRASCRRWTSLITRRSQVQILSPPPLSPPPQKALVRTTIRPGLLSFSGCCLPGASTGAGDGGGRDLGLCDFWSGDVYRCTCEPVAQWAGRRRRGSRCMPARPPDRTRRDVNEMSTTLPPTGVYKGPTRVVICATELRSEQHIRSTPSGLAERLAVATPSVRLSASWC